MKKVVFALAVAGLLNAFNASADDQMILQCSFLESMSVSFGFSSVYTVRGTITDAGSAGGHFYEVNGPVEVSIDDTGSTNTPARHLGDTGAVLNNHPWGNRVLVDVASASTSGADAFRILVFSAPSNTPNPIFSAYKITSLNGNGLAGSCQLDPRLRSN